MDNKAYSNNFTFETPLKKQGNQNKSLKYKKSNNIDDKSNMSEQRIELAYSNLQNMSYGLIRNTYCTPKKEKAKNNLYNKKKY